MNAPAFQARPITTEHDLAALWQIDAEGYGDSAISMDTFRHWWSACPSGLTALFENDHVAGGLGCWPLPATTFEALTHGEILESQIAEGGFGDMATSRHWYVSGVILRPRTRGSRAALLTLLGKGFHGPLGARDAADAVQVAALGYSPEGRALARGLGFRDAGICTRDGLLVFSCTAKDLSATLGRVERLRERAAGVLPAATAMQAHGQPATWSFGSTGAPRAPLKPRLRQSA